jgi:hypothetical protein
MSTLEKKAPFRFSCICNPVTFCGIALMLLAARMKRYGCGGMRAVVFPASFS